MMFLAIVLVPVVGMIAFGGGEAVMTRLADTAPNLLDMVPDTSTTGIIGIISRLPGASATSASPTSWSASCHR